MKFSNMFSFISNKTLSIILLILCILVALVFSNMNLFRPTPNVEGLMTLGDASAVAALIAQKENVMWDQLTKEFKDPRILAILSDPSSPSTQFGKLRTSLKSPDAIKDLTDVNLILSQGYKELLRTLIEQYGTNVDINPTLTQGCDGAESCVINTKKAVEAVLSSAGGGGGGAGGGLGL